jgi:hypothetical protein
MPVNAYIADLLCRKPDLSRDLVLDTQGTRLPMGG